MPAFADQIVSINNGDSAALVAALRQANQTAGVTTIVLAQRGSYTFSAELPAITGSIILEGRGATLAQGAASASAGRLVVNGTGSATVRELNLTGYRGAPLESSGRLSLEAVSLHSNTPSGLGVRGAALIAALPNGHVSAINVTIADNTTSGNQQFLGFVYNQGTMDLRHITIAGNRRGATATGSAGPFAIFNETQQPARVAISNSLFANPSFGECAGVVTSRGGNVFDDATCAPGSSDVVASAPGPFGAFDSSDRVAILPLVARSAAIDRGAIDYCTAGDALGTTRRGPSGGPGCDAGAFELKQLPLAGDGMNGVYYGANNDGQYVSIQRLSSTTALIVWYGFDGAGRNTWVFGVGDVSGTRITASAFQQTTGTLGSDGVVRGAQVTPFGTLTVSLASCDSASLDYASTHAAFGTGRVPLRRLTVTHNVGCSG